MVAGWLAFYEGSVDRALEFFNRCATHAKKSGDNFLIAQITFSGGTFSLIATLPKREQMIIHLRFFRGMTQSEIAARLGISQMHVSRLLARSLAQLRDRAGAEAAPG